MATSIRSFAEFDTRLRDALFDIKRVVAQYPTDRQIAEVQRQLDLAYAFTRGGKEPTLAQKGQLNFGLLASKYLSDVDSALADNLYELASYITYWP